MQRRQFFTRTTQAALAAGLPFSVEMPDNQDIKPKITKPLRLQPGMTIGLIAPSSSLAEAKIQQALTNLTTLGFKTKLGPHVREQLGFLAGPDDGRLADLHAAFADPEVDAVWCLRGGYGLTRILHRIDFELIKRHPKPLLGYSDITALHVAVHQKTGLVTLHAQAAVAEFTPYTLRHLQDTLLAPTAPYVVPVFAEMERPSPEYQPFTIRHGRAEGRLTGGNLCLLAAMCGTPFEPKFAGRMVFLEDVGEQPYRIDRMLTQLLHATDLSKAAGIALGVFNDCQPKPDSLSLSLEETLRDRLGNLGIPVLAGLPFGHISNQCVMPLGVEATLDTEAQTLTFLETAVR
jgi:muramoyltetrapeptide carboxypeptidase